MSIVTECIAEKDIEWINLTEYGPPAAKQGWDLILDLYSYLETAGLDPHKISFAFDNLAPRSFPLVREKSLGTRLHVSLPTVKNFDLAQILTKASKNSLPFACVIINFNNSTATSTL